MSEHYQQWMHLYKARTFTRARLEKMNMLNMESRYRDEAFFARKHQIQLLSELLEQQDCGLEDIQNNYLTDEEQGDAVVFALSYEPIKRGS